MPYKTDDFATQPGPETARKAARYKIDFWRQVNVQDIKEVKSHLHAGYPVLIGANVDAAFRQAARRHDLEHDRNGHRRPRHGRGRLRRRPARPSG